MWYNTKASKILGIEYPILQGPFGGGLSSVELLASVSNLGGLGGYGAYTLSPKEIIEIDNKIKLSTNKPYNINLWVSDSDAPTGTVSDESFDQAIQLFKPYFDEVGVALPEKPVPFKSRFENQVQVILDIKPKLFSFVFGTPSSYVLELCHKAGIKTAGTATTPDEALFLESAGVDLIIASGFEAGGHRPSFLAPAIQSTMGTFVLVQLIKEKVQLPVIAAGGIANGRGIAGALTLGADGVQVGTAFLGCNESGALKVHREMLFSDSVKHTILSSAFTGRLGRGISNRLALELAGKEKQFLPFPLQSAFLSSLRTAALEKKKNDLVFFWSGQIAPILKHRTAAKLMQSLLKETTQLMG